MRRLTALFARRQLAPLLLSLALAAQFFLPRSASAYVLPAEFLSRLIADGRRPSLRDASMTVRLTYGPKRLESAAPLETQSTAVFAATSEARWSFKRPDLLRIETMTADGQEQVEILRGGMRWLGDRASQTAHGRSRNLMPLLLFPGGKDLDEASAQVLAGLQNSGLDTNTTTLARWQQGFAYVIGGAVWEVDKPQLWLDKATFVPLRLLWPTDGPTPAGPPLPASEGFPVSNESFAPSIYEIRLDNYVAGLPRAWEEWDRGELRYRAEVVHLLINQRLEDDLFTPHEATKAGHPPARR